MIKDLIRSALKSGWTGGTLGAEMRRLGHPWAEYTASSLTSRATKRNTRHLTVDEAASLLAIFGGQAKSVATQVNKAISALIDKDKAGQQL
jgi:hypothetical protein